MTSFGSYENPVEGQTLKRFLAASLFTLGVCFSSGAISLQSGQSNVRGLFKSRSPLTDADMTRLLVASYAAMDHQAFRVTLLPRTGGSNIRYELQMGAAGRPRYLWGTIGWTSAFSDYTGQLARACTGDILGKSLVIDYVIVHDGQNPVDVLTERRDGWVPDGKGGRLRIEAREQKPNETLSEVFDMYATNLHLAVGERATVDGHDARALVMQHVLGPGEFSRIPMPPEVQDWLWIDVDSLFIVRWEMRNQGRSTNYGYAFAPDPSLQVRRPQLPLGLKVPTCVK